MGRRSFGNSNCEQIYPTGARKTEIADCSDHSIQDDARAGDRFSDEPLEGSQGVGPHRHHRLSCEKSNHRHKRQDPDLRESVVTAVML